MNKPLSANSEHVESRIIRTKGKAREIWMPGDELREEHRQALDVLQPLAANMPHALGGMKGNSVYDNIARHRESNDFYLLDLKDAYQSVKIDKLRKIVRQSMAQCAISGSFKDIDDFITSAATIEGVPGLPLGLPASPFLCNIYFSPMDAELHYALNNRVDSDNPRFVTITRWIDDIALSAVSKVFSNRGRQKIREIIIQNGGEINHGKTKHHNLRNAPVTITGMSLYPDKSIGPSRQLMGQMVKCLARSQEKLAKGDFMQEDLDVLNGHKGILYAAGSPLLSERRSVWRLAEEYEAFIEEAVASLAA